MAVTSVSWEASLVISSSDYVFVFSSSDQVPAKHQQVPTKYRPSTCQAPTKYLPRTYQVLPFCIYLRPQAMSRCSSQSTSLSAYHGNDERAVGAGGAAATEED
eukprot:432359-Pleurochrysis_carterae.AAC.1